MRLGVVFLHSNKGKKRDIKSVLPPRKINQDSVRSA